MTNNPAKYGGLEGYGLDIVGRVSLEQAPNPENVQYLRTKQERLGHLLSGLDLVTPEGATPGTATPEGAKPGTATPEGATPGTATPEGATPK